MSKALQFKNYKGVILVWEAHLKVHTVHITSAESRMFLLLFAMCTQNLKGKVGVDVNKMLIQEIIADTGSTSKIHKKDWFEVKYQPLPC